MKKITVEIDTEDALREIESEQAVEFFGAQEVLRHITNAEYIEMCDVDQLIEDIDEMHESKIMEYVQEKYSDD